MENEENILGKEKIGKLIRKFAVPCIISLLVNSLYNIVDQIFIGNSPAGKDGNAATSIIFPLVMVALAFSLMFGDGASAFLSLKLGEKKKEEAAKGVASGIISSIIISIILCATSLIFLPQLLNIFGCTDKLRPFASDYGYIISIGLPFMMIGTTLNSIIRADGSPKFAMTSMVTGAILNIILDPILIFVFGMDVKGAAIATIISQFITFIINIFYIKKFKSIEINKNTFKFNFKMARKVAMLGVSSFITEMSVVVVASVQNNLLGKYGAQSEFGAETPIAVFGIVMKISQILNSIIIGLAAGAQPIIGYNYGAGKHDRVKKTLKIVLGVSVIISTIAFILFQTIPDKLILIFGKDEGENYMRFACLAFRTYLMLYIINGIQMPAGIFFQAIGKSVTSAIVSSSRQIVFLIPAMITLCMTFGIYGFLYAGPVADGLSFTISAVLLIIEVRRLGKNTVQSHALVDDTSTDNKLIEHMVITVSREYGSGGRYVARLVADKLGIKFYDKDFIRKLAEETGLSEEFIEENEQKRSALANLDNVVYNGLSNTDELFVKESELVKEVAQNESCVIVGRCSDFILKDMPNVLKVFVYSDDESKIKRATKIYGLSKEKAKKEIKRIDKLRSNHYKYYTGKEWKDNTNYDICINSDKFGVEQSAEIICDMLKSKIKV